MIFLKDFMNMSKTARSDCYLHYGAIDASSRRVRSEILGQSYEFMNVDTQSRFQKTLDTIVPELEEPYQMLLILECGTGICRFDEIDQHYGYSESERIAEAQLSDDEQDPELECAATFCRDYLTETPFSVIQMDFNQACSIIREAFQTI